MKKERVLLKIPDRPESGIKKPLTKAIKERRTCFKNSNRCGLVVIIRGNKTSKTPTA